MQRCPRKRIMDNKKSILNVSVSMGFKLVIMVMSILVRRALIRACGNDVNGLNSLYLSIIGFLAVAELGVGSAITFCMYRPIVAGDTAKVGALYHLFRRLYRIIGGVIFLAGLVLTPFIHHFARDYGALDVNLYTTFLLMLLSVVISYLYGAEISLINAYKNNYITTAITSGGILLQNILQILVLKITGSFHGYLICRVAAALVQWIATCLVARKHYAPVLACREKIDGGTRRELSRNIRAMFMHKIGGLLVNTVDSVVISAFVGVVALGGYANYTAIQSSMDGLIRLVFGSLTSVLGHLYVEKSKETVRQYCEAFHLLNFVLGAVFYLGYYAVADSLVAMLFGPELIGAKTISRMVALNGFVQFMRCSTMVFRDATGTFYYDRWKPLVEGAVNIVLSVLLVNHIGVTGVIGATIITNLLICHIVEPYVLYRHALEASPVKHYLRNYAMIGLFFLGMLAMDRLSGTADTCFMEFLRNGFASVAVSLVLCAGVLLLNIRLGRTLLDALKRREG